MLNQARLNIEARSRTSRLPWRGQFSPEFVEYIMNEVCRESRSFLDPFCGSGTVLFEAAIRGCVSWGVEVNPAAWHLASLVEFSQLPKEEKNYLLKKVRSLAAAYSTQGDGLFIDQADTQTFLEKIIDTNSSHMLSRLLATAVLLGMGNNREISPAVISRGLFSISGILSEMLTVNSASECYLADARYLPLEDEAVEAVITSPPYINVFNYHQNYRPATELLGWKPLEAARSEIGSNRKNRTNRFLTVVQYCMDMCMSLSELSRVMKNGAPIIIVLGRTSKVLGCSFKNGSLIKEVMEESGGFERFHFSERVFTSRFGEKIYEDIIIAERARTVSPKIDCARHIGIKALKSGLKNVSPENRKALNAAIEVGAQVELSPRLELTIPAHFRKGAPKERGGYASHTSAISRR